MIKRKSGRELSNELFRVCSKERIPYRVLFELTYRCNFQCVHCYIPASERAGFAYKELSTRAVCNILDQLQEIGCFVIGFTGGEIFVRKDIWEILHYAKSKGFNVIILTNGYFIGEKEADLLSRLSPNKVDISLHALDKRIFEKITGVKDSFERVKHAIAFLRKSGVNVMIKSCGMVPNKNELLKVIDFANKMHIPHRIGADIMPGRGCRQDLSEYFLSPDDFIRMQHSDNMHVDDPSKRADPLGNRQVRCAAEIFYCGATHIVASITPYGMLRICPDIGEPQCDILKMSLKKSWDYLKNYIDNLKVPDHFECASCDLRIYCDWCPAKGWLERRDIFACSSRAKAKAIALKKLISE